MSRRVLNVALIIVLFAAVVFQVMPAGEPEEAEPDFLGVSGGPTGGSFYPVAAGIARVIEDHVPGVRASAESTGGGAENVALLSERDTDLGIVTLDGYYEAYAEQGYDHLRVLAPGVIYRQLIVVRADSNIHSISDLRGRRASFGPAGASGTIMWHDVLTLHGLEEGDYTPEYLSFSDAADALRDGLIDALGTTIYSAGEPYPVVAELQATTNIRFISPFPTEDLAQRASEEFPLYFVVEIPAGTFDAITEDMTGVAFSTLTGVRGDLSDDLVYEITRAMMEHSDVISEMHPFAAEYVSPGNIRLFYEGGAPIPFHPGALRYFREAGIIN